MSRAAIYTTAGDALGCRCDGAEGSAPKWPELKIFKVKNKTFYGQEPRSRESTTTECGVNYQLLSVIYWSSPMGNS